MDVESLEKVVFLTSFSANFGFPDREIVTSILRSQCFLQNLLMNERSID